MGKARNKRRRQSNPFVEAVIRPTREREAANDFRSAGAARRVIPPIETMFEAGKLTREQFAALDYYRDQANQAQDDAAESSSLAPEKVMGGGKVAVTSGTIPASLLATPAMLETARIENAVAVLKPKVEEWRDYDFVSILQAVARDDLTLTQWCIATHGGRERLDGKGRLVAIVPVAETRVMKMALWALRTAASGIVR